MQSTTNRAAVFALLAALGACTSMFAACVSDTANGAPGSLDGSFDFDSPAGFDVVVPTTDAPPAPADSAPGIPDAGTTDAANVNAADSAIPDAASVDGPIADAAIAYTDAQAPSSWSAFDTASLDAGLGSFSGVTFDGRYAYFAPYASAGRDGIVARLDTQQTFTAPGAWTTFNTKSVLPGTGGFGGAVFDGRYVYLVPFNNSVSTETNGYDQTFVRYDTQGGFTTGASWTQFDVSTTIGDIGPFLGATFDGHYVYFAPRFSSYVPIYDTTQPLTSASAWSGFDTQTLTPPEPSGGTDVFAGTIFDGKYVYFLGPIVARHDTTAAADAGAASWETFDPQTSADAGAFPGAQYGGFDGRYLYLVNQANDVVLRYDTRGTFSSPASWSTFDVATAGGAAGGFFGVNFDGRTLYLAPNSSTVAMYDTLSPFNAATSWTTFNAATLTTVPIGYETMQFDGQYLYVAASTTTPILRLEVTTGPGPLPPLPEWHGSFF